MDSSFVVNIMKVASDFTRSARESFISSFNSLRVSKSVSHLLVKDILSCIRCASKRSNSGTIRSRYPAPATMPTIVNVVSKSFNSNCQVQMRYAPPYSVLTKDKVWIINVHFRMCHRSIPDVRITLLSCYALRL